MNLGTRDAGAIVVLDLSGKLTLGDGDEVLRATVGRLIADGRTQIVVNLEKVPYMDSAGMGELIASHTKASQAGGAVRLLNPMKRVYDVLHVVKLDSVFQIFLEESTAVASFEL